MALQARYRTQTRLRKYHFNQSLIQELMKSTTRGLRCGRSVVALAVLLGLSSLSPAQTQEKSFEAMAQKFVRMPVVEPDSEMLTKAAAAINFIKRMELPEASKAINAALQLDARNTYLHFFNAFIYHLQARQGDTQKTEMAIEGYQQALRIDPSNWIAQEFLGLAYVDAKQFDRAKLEFSNVLLLNPESQVAVSGLMVSSYLTGDPRTACAMADQLRKAPQAQTQNFVRSSISVYASCGDFVSADSMRQTLTGMDGNASELQRLDRRLAQWKDFYRRNVALAAPAAGTTDAMMQPALYSPRARDGSVQMLAQALTGAGESKLSASVNSSPTAAVASPDTPLAGPRMLLIDVVLLSTQELVSTSKGVNLLSALTLQLGSFGGNLPAYSQVMSSNAVGDAAAATTTAITRAVTVPALAYTLNIANANSSFNEVLARPTLAAIEGLPSEFFSGVNLSAGIVSTSAQGGTTIVPLDKRFGIKLGVTPTFVSQGRVQLKVDAQRTSLNASAPNPRAAYQIETAETTASANVVMNLGDTLVLSGLTEKSSASARDGVPGLQDVPLVQYLFSTKKTDQVQRSVLILVTPRAAVQVAEAAPGDGDSMTSRMKDLRDRFGIANRIPANIEPILNHLQSNDMFREFRQGDVAMERWDRMQTTGDRLKEALEFLYY